MKNNLVQELIVLLLSAAAFVLLLAGCQSLRLPGPELSRVLAGTGSRVQLPPKSAAPQVGEFRKFFTAYLDNQVLPFWTSSRFIDEEHGGFLYHLDAKLQRNGSSKQLIPTLRMLYVRAVAIARTADDAGREQQLAEYERQRDYLIQRFWDHENRGWYWKLDREGNVLDGTKRSIGAIYAIYVLSELKIIVNDQRALDYAERTFDILDTFNHDVDYGGYFEDDSSAAGQQLRNYKDVGSNMHFTLAMARLYQATGKNIHRQRLEELFVIMTTKVLVPDSNNVYYMLTRYWTPMSLANKNFLEQKGIYTWCRNDTVFGHNAELIWYIAEAAIVLDHDLSEIRHWMEVVADGIIHHGMREDGALFLTGPLDGNGPPTIKHLQWWVQQEIMISLIRLYEITGNPDYWEMFEKTTRLAFAHFVPTDQPGSWYRAFDEDWNLVESARAGGPWKTGLHTVRAMLEIERTLTRLDDK